MRETLANALTGTLALCAVLVTGLALRNELLPPRTSKKIRMVEGWEAFAKEGNVMGPADAPVRIVEFSDFECPFCAKASRSLQRVRSKYPDQVAVVYRHYPLSGHRFAWRAALASECAAEQGAFEPYHDLLFRQQDSLGLKKWDRFASESGIEDLGRFRECLESERHGQQIKRDLAAVARLGTRGTPTFIVNGRMFTGTIPDAEWDRLVRRTLDEL